MLKYLWMLLIGIVVGGVARVLMPGHAHIGILLTGLLGIAGSFIGGMIGQFFSKPAEGAKPQPAGFFMSVIGALVVLYFWQHFNP
ncbi:GlsB/YeaQ/YmgE family stress response membrane protein [Ampullimonas aquatilis]|uniref:GlsB/YeaQ/YmgE family stress response membrane protein n=1 Tax=Ampullimonas aquatilis TaxID=1341549 RepID=UPI003C754573